MVDKDINFPPHFSRISGNAASDKNIKDGVCAQIEKNFAKAKWKVQLIITTQKHTLAFNAHLGSLINDFLYSAFVTVCLRVFFLTCVITCRKQSESLPS